VHLRDRRGAERLALELGEVLGERSAEFRFDERHDFPEWSRRHAVLQRRERGAHVRRERIVTERCELTRLGEGTLEIAERAHDALRREPAASVASGRPGAGCGEPIERALHGLDRDDRGEAAEEAQRLGHPERAQPESGWGPHSPLPRRNEVPGSRARRVSTPGDPSLTKSDPRAARSRKAA
jgi:hypothetical protein